MRSTKIYGFAILQDEGEGMLPVAITFKKRSLLMENIPKKIKTKIVKITMTYNIAFAENPKK